MTPDIPTDKDVVYSLSYVTSCGELLFFEHTNSEQDSDGFVIGKDELNGQWCIADAYVFDYGTLNRIEAVSDWMYLDNIPGTLEIEWMAPDEAQNKLERDFELEYLLDTRKSIEIEYGTATELPEPPENSDPELFPPLDTHANPMDSDADMYDYDAIERDIYERYGIRPGQPKGYVH